jgi:hypothetical protein
MNTPHYHEARLSSLADVDGIIHALTTEEQSRQGGHWVCCRVIDLGREGYRGVFFYLPEFSEAVERARLCRD